jgi:hypothetical protein
MSRRILLDTKTVVIGARGAVVVVVVGMDMIAAKKTNTTNIMANIITTMTTTMTMTMTMKMKKKMVWMITTN